MSAYKFNDIAPMRFKFEKVAAPYRRAPASVALLKLLPNLTHVANDPELLSQSVDEAVHAVSTRTAHAKALSLDRYNDTGTPRPPRNRHAPARLQNLPVCVHLNIRLSEMRHSVPESSISVPVPRGPVKGAVPAGPPTTGSVTGMTACLFLQLPTLGSVGFKVLSLSMAEFARREQGIDKTKEEAAALPS